MNYCRQDPWNRPKSIPIPIPIPIPIHPLVHRSVQPVDSLTLGSVLSPRSLVKVKAAPRVSP